MSKYGILVALLTTFTASGALAQDSAGKTEYMAACAGCHGESGKGDGPLAGLLHIETPSLTTLTREKGDGTFPYQFVMWMVDGRQIIRAHGSQMPVWGDRYMAGAMSAEAASEGPEIRELVVRGRVQALVDYLESIQE